MLRRIYKRGLMDRYLIVSAPTLDQLEMKISQMLADDEWTLAGGPLMSQDGWHQAVCRGAERITCRLPIGHDRTLFEEVPDNA